MQTSLRDLNSLFHNHPYLYFYQDILTGELTAQECSFIEKSCNIQKRINILDLACGHGRHSNYFAQRNHKVTGIDINNDFLEMARKHMIGDNVEYFHKNILDINYQQQYELIILLSNTLGFLDREESKTLIDKIYAALKTGGKAFIDIKNRDHIVKELPSCSILEKENNLMIDRLSFDPVDGTTTNRRIYIINGKRIDTPFKMSAYNYHDLSSMAISSGFTIQKTYGNWKGESFGTHSKRIIMILEK